MTASGTATSAEYRDYGAGRSRRGLPLPIVIFGTAVAAALWFGLMLLVRGFRDLLSPAGTFLSGSTVAADFLLYGTSTFPPICFGIFLSNRLLLRIPASREYMKRKAATGRFVDIEPLLGKLLKLACVATACLLPLTLLGANSFWALAPSRIDFRPIFSLRTHYYTWSTVKRIETGCSFQKGHPVYRFVVTLDDKTSIDLARPGLPDFKNAYPQIQSALAGHTYEFSDTGFGESCGAYASKRTLEIMTQPPTK